jgi:capsular polysaccharide biosynthesis protein
MDLQLYIRVIWRFRFLVLGGVILALLLAFASIARFSFDGGPSVTFREKEKWVSVGTLLVTEPDFPIGRSVFEEEVPPVGTDRPQTYTPKFAPSTRFIDLANTYAELVTSDAVREIMLRDGPLRGLVEATPLVATNGSDAPLPMISIRGLAASPEAAMLVAQRANKAFQEYLNNQQDRGGVPTSQRAVLTQVRQPSPATTVMLEGRSKTVPIVVFLTVMLAVIGLAFILENLRPRVRPVADVSDRQEAPRPVRRRRSG